MDTKIPMKPLTKKYIFKRKLAGLPIEVDTEELVDKKTLKLLVDTGIWEKDPAGTDRFWEHSFRILYPIRIIDKDGWNAGFLTPGDHYTE